MSQIDKLRKQIDKIDFQILDLLKKRSKIAEKIGKEKKSNDLFRPERQASILRNILKKNGNSLNPSYILSFWRSIFLSQIDVQGGIKLILSNNIANSFLKTIIRYVVINTLRRNYHLCVFQSKKFYQIYIYEI